MDNLGAIGGNHVGLPLRFFLFFIIFIVMKYLFSLLLIFSVAVWAVDGPVSYYGKFKANGAYFRSSKTGKVMQVKGVSFFWSQWTAGSDFYNENAVERMAQDWKAEIVRAAYGATGSAFEDAEAELNRKLVENVVEAAIKNDIYVIIDWHSHSAHNAAETEKAKKFFAYFAQKYKDYDNVIFELYNEPLNATWQNIKDYAEKVIPEIRKYSENLILVGTPNYSQQINDVIGNTVTDSKSNVGYVLHFYAASHSLESFKTNPNINIESVRTSLPIFVTEFGTTHSDGGNPDKGNYNSHNASKTDEWLEYLNKRSISYVAWSLSHKHEGSAFFGETSGTFNQTVPGNWTNTSFMTASGAYIMNMLRTSYEKAPWNPAVVAPVLKAGKASTTGLRAVSGRVYVDIAKGGETRINAYSLNGAFLKTVFSGYLSAGNHKFALDLPKGAFVLRLSQKNDNFAIIVIEK